jgi:hypothetical protein
LEPGHSEPLLPELREAELTLDHALAEACSTKPATAANTGELIKIEEMLQIANEAAKHAISLRRRRRADRTKRAERWAMGDAEAAASVSATHRTFTDAAGVGWDVYAVYPELRAGNHSPLMGTFQQGWLCFDSGTEKRRLSPIPEDWRTISAADLEKLAQRAEVASKTRRRSRGDRGPDDRPASG